MKREKCKVCRKSPDQEYYRAYLRLFGTCWGCDAKKWITGKISLGDFKCREIKTGRVMLDKGE